MIRSIALPVLMAAGAVGLLTPASVRADDRYYYGDRDRGYYDNGYRDRHEEHEYRERRRHREHEWREHERHEWREHEWREHNRYRNGYYDHFGYWHPYSNYYYGY